jgi:membrane-anchored protein YejM (alkaline phosphatase superfamily)
MNKKYESAVKEIDKLLGKAKSEKIKREYKSAVKEIDRLLSTL